MLQNAYIVENIGDDTAEKESNYTKLLINFWQPFCRILTDILSKFADLLRCARGQALESRQTRLYLPQLRSQGCVLRRRSADLSHRLSLPVNFIFEKLWTISITTRSGTFAIQISLTSVTNMPKEITIEMAATCSDRFFRLRPRASVTSLLVDIQRWFCRKNCRQWVSTFGSISEVQKEAREIPLPSPVPRAVNNLVASRAAVRSFVMQWKTIYISSMIDGA